MDKYEVNANRFKALSDPNRLKIMDLLSCGELCACELLKHFDFTQPTLSHHMKILQECELVMSRKQGIWNYYGLNNKITNKSVLFLMEITTDTDDCVCKN